MKFNAMAIAIASMATANAVRAASYTHEWRVIGPAFALHLGSDGQIVKPGEQAHECRDAFEGGGSKTIISPTPLPNLVSLGRDDHGNYLYAIGSPSGSQCSTVIAPAQRSGWSGNNPAVGLRYTRRFDSHSDTALVNLVRDSYGSRSAMVAVGRMWPVLDVGSISVDAGVVGGLWYRSVLNPSSDGLVRRIVPFALPSASITEKRSGIGLDLGFAPRISVSGYVVNRTPTVMAQLTYLVSKTTKGETRLSLENTGSGVRAELSASF